MSDTLTTHDSTGLLDTLADFAENPEATDFDDGMQLAAIALLGWLEGPEAAARREKLTRMIEQPWEDVGA